MSVALFPNAKVNIGLYVVGCRPDGYHNIETIFLPIPLRDRIDVSEDEEDMLLMDGITICGRIEDNLVMRVLRNVRRDYDVPPVRISLTKNIPFGAGLGGGSSDAAHMMKALNAEFQLDMTKSEMERRLSTIGADCAFFVRNRPIFAQGIGNEFTEIELSLTGWHLVLVKPDVPISTREAYASIHPQQPVHPLIDAVRQPVSQWRHLVSNDFERSVFPSHPIISDIKHTLYQLGATYASMSGSGSSVFALFDHHPRDLEDIFTPHFVFEATL